MKRTLQRLTGFHKIHHITFGYGYKIPFSNYGLFISYAKKFKDSPFQKLDSRYHDCTLTGIN